MELLTSPPSTSSFIPLAVHQSRTPDSFHSGPAILHYHASNCKLIISDADLTSSPLNALRGANTNAHGDTNAVNGSSTDPSNANDIILDGLDVWVTSDKFLLYNPSASAGISIPYPSISLHAIQRLTLPLQAQSQPEVQGLYMHITKQSPSTSSSPYPQQSDEEESITMTLVPPGTPPPTTATPTGADAESKPDNEEETESPTQKLYAAVSACSNLHPDPIEDEEEEGAAGAFASGLVFPGSGEGGLPPPVDGSSGWITAENMHQFFDEEGNWIGGGEGPSLPLGPGAGTVRGREEENGGDGEGEGEGENGGEETKWRRTD